MRRDAIDRLQRRFWPAREGCDTKLACRSSYAMSAPKRMRPDPQRMVDTAIDLMLVCSGNALVLVSSDMLLRASCCPAIEDSIAHLREGWQDAAPMELPVPDDSADVWRVVWSIIQHPMAREPQGLTWGNLTEVITLADKYAITLVLQTCERFMLMALMHSKPTVNSNNLNPFGKLCVVDYGPRFSLKLPFLELLFKVEMHSALDVMAPLYTQLLHECCSRLADLKQQMMARGFFSSQLSVAQQGVRDNLQAITTATRAYRTAGSGDQVAAARVVELIQEQVVAAMQLLV